MNCRTLLLSVALLAPCLAVADPRPVPTAEVKKQANEHFERGRTAYNFGNYDLAISEYQAAFDLTGAPEFVFNIAQSHRTKGSKQLAYDFYKKYIELDPKGDGVVSARAHMDAIEKELHTEAAEVERRRQAEAESERQRGVQAEAARRAATETARRLAEQAAQQRVGDAETARRRANARYVRIAGISVGGAALATFGVSAYFGYRARSLSHEASAVTGTWTEEAQATIDRAESSERTMFILLGVGGATAILGGVIYFLGSRKIETPPIDPKRITVTPGPLPGGAAVFVHGSF